jgi:hypothetical protein
MAGDEDDEHEDLKDEDDVPASYSEHIAQQ